VNRKREINVLYNKLLSGNDKVRVSSELKGCKSIYWMTSIELIGASFEDRENFMKKLKENMIDSRPVFSPMSSLPMFEKRTDNPVAYRIGLSSVNLPSGHNLTNNDIKYVCNKILSIC
jgi:perosamine synthetase